MGWGREGDGMRVREVVLDSGELVESGTAYHLLQRSDSVFTKLVDKSGQQMAISLRRMARKYCSNKLCERIEDREADSGEGGDEGLQSMPRRS
ncbi:unnamed protein product, partial [Oppiella nova]